MKYEIKSAEWAFLRTIIVLIFYFIVLFINLYSFTILKYDEIQIQNLIRELLCYPIFQDDNSVSLLYIFINLYFVLYFAVYYLTEHIYFYNSIVTRYNQKKWVIHKYIVGIVFIIIISMLQYGAIFYRFGADMPTSLNFYLYPIIYRILIMSYVYIAYNILNTNKIMGIILIILAIYTLFSFNIILSLVIIVLTFAINLLFFDLRTFGFSKQKLKILRK